MQNDITDQTGYRYSVLRNFSATGISVISAVDGDISSKLCRYSSS